MMTRRSLFLATLLVMTLVTWMIITTSPGMALGLIDSTPTITPTLLPAARRVPITPENAGQIAKVAEMDTHNGGWLLSVAFSPDGTRIAAGGHDGTITLADTQTGGVIAHWAAHTLPVDHIMFTPNGARLVTAGWDNVIRVWDGNAPSSGSLVEITSATRIFDLAVSRDWLASAHGDGAARVWSLADYTRVVTLDTPATAVYSVAFNADASQIAIGTDGGEVRLFDTDEWWPREPIPGQAQWVLGITFSPQGDVVATGHLELNMMPWPYTPDRFTPLTIHNDVLVARDRHNITLFAFPAGDRISGIDDSEIAFPFDAALSPDGTLIAVTTRRGTVHLWGVP